MTDREVLVVPAVFLQQLLPAETTARAKNAKGGRLEQFAAARSIHDRGGTSRTGANITD